MIHKIAGLPGTLTPSVTSKDVREPASSYYAGLAKCSAAGAQLALVTSNLILSLNSL